MNVTIGTFNLNNLFSRYNFTSEIEAIKDEKTAVEAEYVYRFGSTDRLKIRKYRGKLVQRKDAEDTRGDMNDAPDSSYLTSLTSNAGLELTNAPTDPKEIRPTQESQYPPPGPAWTPRYKPKGGDMQYELYDQIWLSPLLAKRQTGAWIHRRKNLTGDGSDHDPAWVELSL
jgi:hypothetical protein